MTIRVLLDPADRQGVLHEQVSSGKLVRIDAKGVELEPGEAIKFAVTTKSALSLESRALEPFDFVGDDPRPEGGANFSLQVRADRGDWFWVEATAGSSGR